MSSSDFQKAYLWLGWLLILVTITACGHPMQRKLQGRWLGESIENIDQSLLVAANGWAKGASFEFAGDRMTVIIPAEEPRSGNYSVDSVRDDRIALRATRIDGTVDPVELRLDDEHSLRWMLPNGAAIHMRKTN